MDQFIKPKRCLGYMDLRTGGIVVGHFHVALGIYGVIECIMKIIMVNELDICREILAVLSEQPLPDYRMKIIIGIVVSRMYHHYIHTSI